MMMMNMKLFSKSAIVAAAAIVCCHTTSGVLGQGIGSVVREGKDNVAPGEYCTIGGGEENDAGNADYNVIGGGLDNGTQGDKGTISGGKNNFIEDEQEANRGITISGGSFNIIDDSTFSVITGGGRFGDGNSIDFGSENIISGGIGNSVDGSKKCVVTGGVSNAISSDSREYCVVTGGNLNSASGTGSVIVGGTSNTANGDYSIVFGEEGSADFDSSMVVGLTGGKVATEDEGQFLAVANSFRFQIGDGEPKQNGDPQFAKITDENIQNLIDALNE